MFVIFALLVTDVCWDSETVTSSFTFTVHAISSNDYMSILASFSVVFNLWQESRIKIPSCHKGKDDTSLMSTDQTIGVFFF